MEINRVLVVGAGMMGSGIAQTCAQAGIEVILTDVAADALTRAIHAITWSVNKLIEKGKLSEARNPILERITTTTELESVREVDLAIEAVFENKALKLDIFKKLDALCPHPALLSSNTSAIPITELAAVTDRPDRVMGLHFFSPVPMMAAVEVIRGVATDDETAEAGRQFVVKIGKEPIVVNRDVAGFVINRINLPSQIEAMNLVASGVATVEDIDKGLRLAAGRKMGIFETNC